MAIYQSFAVGCLLRNRETNKHNRNLKRFPPYKRQIAFLWPLANRSRCIDDGVFYFIYLNNAYLNCSCLCFTSCNRNIVIWLFGMINSRVCIIATCQEQMWNFQFFFTTFFSVGLCAFFLSKSNTNLHKYQIKKILFTQSLIRKCFVWDVYFSRCQTVIIQLNVLILMWQWSIVLHVNIFDCNSSLIKQPCKNTNIPQKWQSFSAWDDLLQPKTSWNRRHHARHLSSPADMLHTWSYCSLLVWQGRMMKNMNPVMCTNSSKWC